MSEFLGKTIGQFQLVELIDESGSALVYKGFQPSLNRYVAVKILKPGTARDPEAVQRFLQFEETATQMDHPNLLPVLDSGQSEGIVYRVTPFVENGTLKDNLSSFYNPYEALNLMKEIVAALEYIHSQGYVHGNLKPTNIFLDPQRRPMLSDFGFRQPSEVTPTPYMSPEQVRGGVVDQRTDVYALGVLLYEMLVGQAPPVGAVVSPRAKRPDLSQQVETVIFKSMAQNPVERFQSAGEFLQALVEALGAPAPAPPPEPVPAPAPVPTVSQSVTVEGKKGTNWSAILLAAFLVIVLCVGGYFIYSFLIDSQGSETEVPPTQGPIEVTVVLPTDEPRPTRDPGGRPTDEPEQPPEEKPTDPPVINPTGGAGDLPPEEGNGPSLPICESAGFALGALGLVLYRTKRKQQNKPR
jgi:serine/threonine protein kinase